MKKVDPFAYAGHICSALKKGVLLTTKAGNKVNTMTIGWGTIGIEWNRPIFIAYVRESRFTREMLEENAEFTVNIPVSDVPNAILKECGTKSGRDADKIAEMNLTLVDSEIVGVPGILELPLTLECRVIYQQEQDLSRLPADILKRFYPEESDGNRDFHIAYYGEIVNAYLAEEC